MSEIHADADVVKVTRTTTSYEPVQKSAALPAERRRNSRLIWVIGAVVAVAIIAGGLWYFNGGTVAPTARQSAVVAEQSSAQALSQQATTAQQGAQDAQKAADQSATQAASLTAAAARDRAASKRAAQAADANTK